MLPRSAAKADKKVLNLLFGRSSRSAGCTPRQPGRSSAAASSPPVTERAAQQRLQEAMVRGYEQKRAESKQAATKRRFFPLPLKKQQQQQQQQQQQRRQPTAAASDMTYVQPAYDLENAAGDNHHMHLSPSSSLLSPSAGSSKLRPFDMYPERPATSPPRSQQARDSLRMPPPSRAFERPRSSHGFGPTSPRVLVQSPRSREQQSRRLL